MHFRSSITFSLIFIPACFFTTSESQDITKDGEDTKSIRPETISNYNSQNISSEDATSVLNPIRKESLMETTTRLMDEWEKIRVKEGHPEEVILVAGNTGAGKSTITKFLTGMELEAYEVNEQILIRDKEGSISTTGTIVSKTIFPQLIYDKDTQTAFYDLPGFSDTRNASIEIANAFFMAKVAERAKRVKLLFIVTYSGLKSGGSRTEIPTFLRRTSDFIKNPRKFSKSMGLIASKVELRRATVRGITKFLEDALNQTSDIISDQQQLENSMAFLDIILDKERQVRGASKKIGLFRQPMDVGPLYEMEDMLQVRADLRRLVWDNLEFTEKDDQDFGVSLSSDARYLVSTLSEKASLDISKSLQDIALKIFGHFTRLIDLGPVEGQQIYHTLSSLNKGFIVLQQTLDNIENSPNGDNKVRVPSEFAKILNLTLHDLNLEVPEIEANLNAILKQSSQLDFFSTVSPNSAKLQVSDWTSPFRNLTRHLGPKIVDASKRVAHFIEKSCNLIADDLRTSFRSRLNQEEVTLSLQRSLEQDIREIQGATDILEDIRSPLIFTTILKDLLENLTVNVSTDLVSQLPNNNKTPDLNGDLSLEFNETLIGFTSPYNPHLWVGKFKNLLIYLIDEKTSVQNTLAGRVHKEEKERLLQLLQNVKETAALNFSFVQDLMKSKDAIYNSTITNLQKNLDDLKNDLRSTVRQGEEKLGKLQTTCKSEKDVLFKSKTDLQTQLRGVEGKLRKCSKDFDDTWGRNAIVGLYDLESKETNSGTWGSYDRCPAGTFVDGISLKVERIKNPGPRPHPSDLRTHGVKFRCKGGSTISSRVGGRGEWGAMWPCPGSSKAIGFEWKWEYSWQNADDGGVSKIRLICEGDKIPVGQENGPGSFSFTYTKIKCLAGHFLCGLQTQVKDIKEISDGSALNNIRLRCCQTTRSPINTGSMSSTMTNIPISIQPKRS